MFRISQNCLWDWCSFDAFFSMDNVGAVQAQEAGDMDDEDPGNEGWSLEQVFFLFKMFLTLIIWILFLNLIVSDSFLCAKNATILFWTLHLGYVDLGSRSWLQIFQFACKMNIISIMALFVKIASNLVGFVVVSSGYSNASWGDGLTFVARI